MTTLDAEDDERRRRGRRAATDGDAARPMSAQTRADGRRSLAQRSSGVGGRRRGPLAGRWIVGLPAARSSGGVARGLVGVAPPVAISRPTGLPIGGAARPSSPRARRGT